jgi:hypothetical protein
MRITASFHKENNIIGISLNDSNKCPIFKRASARNILLETMFWCNKNFIIIIIL